MARHKWRSCLSKVDQSLLLDYKIAGEIRMLCTIEKDEVVPFCIIAQIETTHRSRQDEEEKNLRIGTFRHEGDTNAHLYQRQLAQVDKA